MTDRVGQPAGDRLMALGRGLALRCPRCGQGRLFRGWFRMHDRCAACGASFAREPGFYLGSIYINYGVTVIVTGALYAALVGVAGVTPETALAACLVVAVVLPVVFFRHARSLLLALDSSVNRRQAGAEGAEQGSEASTGHAVPSARELKALSGDDARAGCLMGIVLVLIILFGLLMAAATLWFASQPDDGASALETVGSRCRAGAARARA